MDWNLLNVEYLNMYLILGTGVFALILVLCTCIGLFVAYDSLKEFKNILKLKKGVNNENISQS